MRRRVIRVALQPLSCTTEARLRYAERLPKRGIRQILVCRPNHRLGNLLLLTPLIRELERVFPEAEVDIVLAGGHGPDLFRGFGNVKRIYGLSRRMVRHPITIMRTLLQIRQTRYDLAIDPCEASQSGRFLLAWAKATHMIGIPRGDSSPTSNRTMGMPEAPTHMAQRPVYLLRRALSRHPPEFDSDYPPLTIRLSADERRWARQVLDTLTCAGDDAPGRVIIGLFVDATGAKRYDMGWWQRFIAEMLAGHADYSIVEIAPPDGISRLASQFPSFSSPSPRKVAAVISNMTCFVSADCGVMHLASASGTPTIGLFSVTDVSKYEPYGPGSAAIATNGKSPEEVARLASAMVEAIRMDDAGPCGCSARGEGIGQAGCDAVADRRQTQSGALPTVRSS